ncbi:hypothetical protein [Actinoplanes sp. HUAS TT8]|uniref:hypothetical protein n=1 Tax=Actinoplanes sp. HUAS TT8 TaxID=3447453 RepID=UPI003F51CC64
MIAIKADRRSSRWLLWCAAGTLAAGAIAVGVLPPVRTDPPSASPSSDQALGDGQNSLSELREWIRSRPGIDSSGYIESVNDAGTRSTTLLWHGPADDLQQQIRDEAARRGIAVTVQQRRYTVADLNAALKKLDGRSGRGAFANFTIYSSAGLSADFDGVTVSGEYRKPPAEGTAAADAALAEAASAELGIAVAIEHGGEILPA